MKVLFRNCIIFRTTSSSGIIESVEQVTNRAREWWRGCIILARPQCPFFVEFPWRDVSALTITMLQGQMLRGFVLLFLQMRQQLLQKLAHFGDRVDKEGCVRWARFLHDDNSSPTTTIHELPKGIL